MDTLNLTVQQQNIKNTWHTVFSNKKCKYCQIVLSTVWLQRGNSLKRQRIRDRIRHPSPLIMMKDGHPPYLPHPIHPQSQGQMSSLPRQIHDVKSSLSSYNWWPDSSKILYFKRLLINNPAPRLNNPPRSFSLSSYDDIDRRKKFCLIAITLVDKMPP